MISVVTTAFSLPCDRPSGSAMMWQAPPSAFWWLFTSYISRFWSPITTLANFYNSLLTAISYLERIFETIDEPVAVKDAPDAVDMPPITGKVTFDHVKFQL